MSEITSQTNAIILASAERLVELGAEASQRMLEGKDSKQNYVEGHKILTLMTAYVMQDELEESEVDALLYCLRKLSGASEFPTIEPLVGQGITYVIDGALQGGVGGLPPPEADSVIWSDGTEWHVITVEQLAEKLAPHILKF